MCRRPQIVKSEKSVLGALDAGFKRTFWKLELLDSEDFIIRHIAIYEAMVRLITTRAVDIVTMDAELPEQANRWGGWGKLSC